MATKENAVKHAAGNTENATYSKGYLRYALGLMFMVTLFNYTDRFVLSILIDPIQKDTGLSDSQIGLLTGIAFAVVYSFLNIPIGRLADRFNRVQIVAVAVTVWSGFTVLFGLAANYTQMILARIGVAAGEAGGINPIYSIIGDYYPAEKRGTAASIITLGASVGTMIGFALAGLLNDLVGWRMTFVSLGLAGAVLGPLVLFTLKEPLRGLSDGIVIEKESARESFGEAVAELWGRRSYIFLLIGMGVAGIGSMGPMTWLPTFFIRKFAVTTTEIGAWSAAGSAIPMAVSTLAGGILFNRLYHKDPRWGLWLPAIGLAIGTPTLILQLLMPSLPMAILVGVVPAMTGGLMGPPLLAISLTLSGARLRTLGGAFMSLAMYLVGMGIGPSLVGVISQLALPFVGGDTIISLGMAIGFASLFYVISAGVLCYACKTLKADIARTRDYDGLRNQNS